MSAAATKTAKMTPSPTGFAEGDPLPEEDFNDNKDDTSIDYCIH